MNRKEIEDLIKFVSKAGVSEVSIETKEIKITIKNTQKQPEYMMMAPQAMPQQMMAAPQAAPAAAAASAPTAEPPAESSSGVDESKLHVIKSPMIGTFYRSSAPDKPNFVNVGDEIKDGKIICIIEAMKLFNEIEADVAGRIVKVLVDNASPVEYDQPLFLVEPK